MTVGIAHDLHSGGKGRACQLQPHFLFEGTQGSQGVGFTITRTRHTHFSRVAINLYVFQDPYILVAVRCEKAKAERQRRRRNVMPKKLQSSNLGLNK